MGDAITTPFDAFVFLLIFAVNRTQDVQSRQRCCETLAEYYGKAAKIVGEYVYQNRGP